jgi:hypothetical protein
MNDRLEAALDYINALPTTDVLDLDMESLTKKVEQFAITPPIVRADQCARDEQTRELVDATFDRKTGSTGHVLLIPIEGEAEWLQEIRGQIVPTDDHPLAFLDEKRNWIYIKLTISSDDPEGTLKQSLHNRVTLVEQYATFVAQHIIEFNKGLAERMTADLNKRKAALQRARIEAQSVGLPVVNNPKKH